jgi:outer membrane usher protein
LQLRVNQVDHGEILVLVRETEVLIPEDDLRKAGLRSIGGRRQTEKGQEYVVLSSLAPKVEYSLDLEGLSLHLTTDPELLDKTTLKLKTVAPPGMTYRSSPSAFLNYSFNLADFDAPSLFTEGGLSLDGKLLHSDLALTPDGRFVRGLSNFTWNQPDDLITFIAGDSFANLGALGGGALFGGLSYAKNFSLNPYFLSFPLPSFSGALTTPSIVDVYVNGTLTRRLELSPGPFRLEDIPLNAGLGDTEIVVQDAFGQVQRFSQPYYLSTLGLKAGLHHYTYNLGFLRDRLGTESWHYGPPVFAARHLLGLTDAITTGALLEASKDLVSGGPEVALRLPIGELALGSVVSNARAGGTGWAGGVSYLFRAQYASFGGSAFLSSDRYATINISSSADRPTLQAQAFAGFQIGSHLSVSPSLSYRQNRDRGSAYLASLVAQLRLSSDLNLQFALSHSRQPQQAASLDAFVGLNYLIGGTTSSTTVTLAYNQHGGTEPIGGLGTLRVQRSLPFGTGLGYLLQGQVGGQAQQIADLQYRGDYGFYQFGYRRWGSVNATRLNLSGGMVAIGGRFLATRPVQDSYALIRVPGVADVTGYAYNQPIGTTDSKGDLFVPNLRSYYGNNLAINDKDIPVDYRIDETSKIVATPYRGGAVVDFPVYRLQEFTGTVRIRKEATTVIPKFGDLNVTVAGATQTSPIGRNGEFYLENLAPGSHRASIQYSGGECFFDLAIPATEDRLVKLGQVICTQH